MKYYSAMVSTLRQLVTVEAGGVVRVQSDVLREGTIAEVMVTAPGSEVVPPAAAMPMSWNAFIGLGGNSGRSVEEIDASVRELRDEWQ